MSGLLDGRPQFLLVLAQTIQQIQQPLVGFRHAIIAHPGLDIGNLLLGGFFAVDQFDAHLEKVQIEMVVHEQPLQFG